MAGAPQATVIQGGFRSSAGLAAMANGALAHAVDYDSVHDEAIGHPESACIPAALAIAESRAHCTGKQLITAIALGSDLYARLGMAITKRSDIWYSVAVISPYAAAAAAAKLLGVSPAKMLDAISLAGCQSTCTWEFHHSRRSSIRAVREAFSAHAGVVGALLADKGVVGVERPISGEAGFYQAYVDGNYDPDVVTRGLGEEFLGERVTFKPYPSCRGTHAFVDAAIELACKYDLAPEDIQAITAFGAATFEYLAKTRTPGSAIDAKFSLRYTVATALLNRRFTLDDFTPMAIARPSTIELGRLLTYKIDRSIDLHDSSRGALEIMLKDGRVLTRNMRYAPGHPTNPLTQDQIISKFRDGLAHSNIPISPEQEDVLITEILSLEELSDASSIMRHFLAPAC